MVNCNCPNGSNRRSLPRVSLRPLQRTPPLRFLLNTFAATHTLSPPIWSPAPPPTDLPLPRPKRLRTFLRPQRDRSKVCHFLCSVKVGGADFYRKYAIGIFKK